MCTLCLGGSIVSGHRLVANLDDVLLSNFKFCLERSFLQLKTKNRKSAS